MSAICKFCDTDFRGTDGPLGGSYHVDQLVEIICGQFPENLPCFVVFTGGEPALQLNQILIDKLHEKGAEIAIETNGTLPLPERIDWICVSPKAGSELVVLQANELKLVVPQAGHDSVEQLMARFEKMDYRNRFLQPMDGPNLKSNTELAVGLCQKRPLWRLSIQSHKLIGIR